MNGTHKDYETPTRDEVETLLRKFLDAPVRQSDRGGFADVPEGDKDELDELILILVKYRYEPDADGDRPIRWQLCDQTRQQPHGYRTLPYDRQDVVLRNVMRIAMFNLSLATDDAQRIWRQMRDE